MTIDEKAPEKPKEVFTIRVKHKGRYYSVTCDQVPGLFLGGAKLAALLEDFERSVKLLKRLGKQSSVRVSK